MNWGNSIRWPSWREHEGGMKRDMKEDGKGRRLKAELMKEDELSFVSTKLGINKRVCKIQWLCVSMHESMCVSFT